MLEIRGDSDLLEESLSAQDSSELGMQNLDRDFAIVLLVVGEINGGHAAGTQLTLDGISRERTLNLFETLSHIVPAS